MSGGAFRNSSNLLGRRREIEDLERQVQKHKDALQTLQMQIDACRLQRNALREEIVRQKDELQKEYLKQNTAKMRLKEQQAKSGDTAQGYERIRAEANELDFQIEEIKEGQEKEKLLLAQSETEEKETEEQIVLRQEELEQAREEEKDRLAANEEMHLKLAGLRQQEQFIRETINRLSAESGRLLMEKEQYEQGIAETAEDIAAKQAQIAEIEQSIADSAGHETALRGEIETLTQEKEQKDKVHKQFFTTREDLSERMSLLDRENFRLNAQIEKLNEQQDGQATYMWEEYKSHIRHREGAEKGRAGACTDSEKGHHDVEKRDKRSW